MCHLLLQVTTELVFEGAGHPNTTDSVSELVRCMEHARATLSMIRASR